VWKVGAMTQDEYINQIVEDMKMLREADPALSAIDAIILSMQGNEIELDCLMAEILYKSDDEGKSKTRLHHQDFQL